MGESRGRGPQWNESTPTRRKKRHNNRDRRDMFIMKGQHSVFWIKVKEAELKTEVESKRSLLCSSNNHSNRKPCPGKLKTAHTCKDMVHMPKLAHICMKVFFFFF